MTSTFKQPDYATQGGTEYPTAIDDSIEVMSRLAAPFAAHESDPLAMTVEVDAGWVFAGTTLTEVAAQTTAALVAPAADPRIDRVVIDAATGAAEVVQGAEDPTPDPPSIPGGKVPICQVALTVGMTEITNADITDERVGVGRLGLDPGPSSELTIAAGAVTVKGGYHTIDTEADAATDNLDTIDVSALAVGEIFVLRNEDNSRVPTVRSGVDNIVLDGPDFALSLGRNALVLQRYDHRAFEVCRSTAPALTEFYESAPQTITSGGFLGLSHGLSSQPKLYKAFLVCVNASAGYSTGDEVEANHMTNGLATANGRGVAILPSAGSLSCRFGSAANVFEVLSKNAGVPTSVANADWSLVVRAWA